MWKCPFKKGRRYQALRDLEAHECYFPHDRITLEKGDVVVFSDTWYSPYDGIRSYGFNGGILEVRTDAEEEALCDSLVELADLTDFKKTELFAERESSVTALATRIRDMVRQCPGKAYTIASRFEEYYGMCRRYELSPDDDLVRYMKEICPDLIEAWHNQRAHQTPDAAGDPQCSQERNEEE